MPRIYTLKQKKHALYVLRQTEDIEFTSLHLGIPIRTLRDWIHEAQRSGSIYPGRDPAASYQGSVESIGAAEIRDRLLAQIEKLTRTVTDDPRKAYFASLAVNHLLEQIKTINEALDIPVPVNTSSEAEE